MYPYIYKTVIAATSSNPSVTSPDNKSGENSGSEAFKPGLDAGGYGSPGNQRSQPDWSLADKLFDSPHLLHGVLNGKCTKEIKEMARNGNEDVKYYFSKQVFEIMVKVIKTSLSLLRRRFVGSKGYKGLHTMPIPGKLWRDNQLMNTRGNTILYPLIKYTVPAGMEDSTFTEESPVFILETQLQGSTVIIKPTMEQIQEAITQIGRTIVASAKGIGQWQVYTVEGADFQGHAINEKKARRRLLYRGLSQDRTGPKYQHFNFYAQVCESKEVSKFTSALANCTQTLKEVWAQILHCWTYMSSIVKLI
jgi:dynein heavy chain